MVVPSLEWVNGRFVPHPPQLQPTSSCRITVLCDSMKTFGVKMSTEELHIMKNVEVEGACATQESNLIPAAPTY